MDLDVVPAILKYGAECHCFFLQNLYRLRKDPRCQMTDSEAFPLKFLVPPFIRNTHWNHYLTGAAALILTFVARNVRLHYAIKLWANNWFY